MQEEGRRQAGGRRNKEGGREGERMNTNREYIYDCYIHTVSAEMYIKGH